MNELKTESYDKDLAEQLDSFVEQYNSWGYTDRGKQIYNKAMHMLNTDHAMYARLPIICKGDNCIYKNDPLHKHSVVQIGEPCICETTMIAQKYAQYKEEFDLDNASYTDKVLVHELITLDLLISRSLQYINNKDYLPVIDVVTNVTETGEEIVQPMVSKGIELYSSLVKKRDDVFSLLVSTRKDKLKNNIDTNDHDVYLINQLSNDDFFVTEADIQKEKESVLNR